MGFELQLVVVVVGVEFRIIIVQNSGFLFKECVYDDNEGLVMGLLNGGFLWRLFGVYGVEISFDMV